MSTVRTPIVVNRKPITLLSKSGIKKSGGWYVFFKPDEQAPDWVLKKSQRILWCPYCGEWRIFTRKKDSDISRCSDCFANTDEFYTRHYNKIWFEDVPLDELRKLDIPRPNGRKK